MSIIRTPTQSFIKYVVGNSTGTFPNAATEYTLTIPQNVTKMFVKMWGGGGGNTPGTVPGSGGNGGYARFSKNVSIGEVYKFSAGGLGNGGNINTGGTGGVSSGGPLQGGRGSGNGTNTNGGAGGGGTVFTQYSGITYTLMAVAGGGGGGGFRITGTNGGAGGSSADGVSVTTFGTTTGGGRGNSAGTGTGGTAGTGGTGTTNVIGIAGTAIVGLTNTTSLSGFNGQGGIGGGAGGGGGYGGGGGSGWSGSTANTVAGQTSGGGGGGSYVSTSITGTLIAGDNGSFPNSTALDSDYITGKGIGSTPSVSSVNNGGTGLIVIILIVPSIILNPVTSLSSSFSTSADIGVVGIKSSTLNNTNGISTTISSASSLIIGGLPAAGTNLTITNAYALNVEVGSSLFNGDINYNTASVFSGNVPSSTSALCMNDNPIYLRGKNQSDKNHFIAWAGSSVSGIFGTVIDGPAIVGFSAGIIGTVSNSAWAMRWTNDSTIGVNGGIYLGVGQSNSIVAGAQTTTTSIGISRGLLKQATGIFTYGENGTTTAYGATVGLVAQNTSTSDCRIKENVTEFSYDFINLYSKIHLVEFDVKKEFGDLSMNKNSLHNVGFLAQEVIEIFPDWIFKQSMDVSASKDYGEYMEDFHILNRENINMYNTVVACMLCKDNIQLKEKNIQLERRIRTIEEMLNTQSIPTKL